MAGIQPDKFSYMYYTHIPVPLIRISIEFFAHNTFIGAVWENQY